MEINKFIKNGIQDGSIKIADKIDYYYKVGRLLRYHYIGTRWWHFFISKKEQNKWNNKLWNGDRAWLVIPKTTKQTMRNNFFYTLAKKDICKIPTYWSNR